MRKKEPQLSVTKLAKKWPLRLLNWLPRKWRFRYLLWKSEYYKNLSEDTPHSYPAFSEKQQGVLFLPTSGSEIILCLPLIEHLQKLSPKSNISLKIVCLSTHSAIVQGFFPNIPILSISPQNFFLDHKQFKQVLKEIRESRPDYFINLNKKISHLSWYMQLHSKAPIRMAIGECPEPFANISLMPGPEHNVFKVYKQIAGFWEAGVSSLSTKEFEVSPDPERTEEVQREFKRANLTSTAPKVLFLWSSDSTLRTPQLNGVGTLFDSKEWQPIVAHIESNTPSQALPDSLVERVPCFEGITYGKLIALLAEVQVVVGFHTPTLLFAHLYHNQVLGLFQKQDSALDLSSLSNGFHVKYLDDKEPLDLKKELQAIKLEPKKQTPPEPAKSISKKNPKNQNPENQKASTKK